VTRGQHYHRRKIERFTVLSGTAEISMRKLFSDEVLTFPVGGTNPVAVDMPTMWSHKITNTGSDELYTMFWINEIFDPSSPDTFPEEV
jgi:UDP-2-acetamido-2,6-beta-L-arabino-hexul-4-ose reductase